MFPIEPQLLLTAGLAFLRVGGILFALPFFGDSTVPTRVRLMLTIAISIGIYPIIPAGWAPQFSNDIIWTAFMVVRELFIGLTIGYVAKLMFEGIILAANIVGYQMGFGTASVIVPDSTAQMSGFTAFHRIIIILIFVSLNLHHTFLVALVDTFKLIPAGAAVAHDSLASLVISTTGAIFSTAIQMAAPILVALLFTMAALGLVARTVPQMNVFTMSFPMSFFIGLAIYLATIPFLDSWLKRHFFESTKTIFLALNSMVPN